MPRDTAIGGPGGRFPVTRKSAVLATRSDDEGERGWAHETLVDLYWKPVYKYLRIRYRFSNEDAKDHTQGFFAKAIEKRYFAAFDPAKGTFRTFLRTCLDRWVANEKKAAGRQKRAGNALVESLDFTDAEGEIRQREIPDGMSLEEYFHREWVRSFFALAVDALRRELEAEGKEVYFTLFERYDLEPPSGAKVTYRDLADELGIAVTDVTNHLASARRRFRRLVLARLREVSASDAEFESEARELLGSTVE